MDTKNNKSFNKKIYLVNFNSNLILEINKEGKVVSLETCPDLWKWRVKKEVKKIENNRNENA